MPVQPAPPAAMSEVLERIEDALRRAGDLAAEIARRPLVVDEKSPGDPVTEADRAADRLLRELLGEVPLEALLGRMPGERMPGEEPGAAAGWLSEETADDGARLGHRRAWIVDPLDGTREFVAGIPEWCVSVGLVEDGVPVAGGVYNPAAGQLVLGAAGLGITFDGVPAAPTARGELAGATVLASRSEVGRGAWEGVAERCGCRVVATGSVAWKLALVAAGRADATWTLVPKNEWDVAAGAALVLAAGGRVLLPDGGAPRFNQPDPLLPGFAAAGAALAAALPPLFTELATR